MLLSAQISLAANTSGTIYNWYSDGNYEGTWSESQGTWSEQGVYFNGTGAAPWKTYIDGFVFSDDIYSMAFTIQMAEGAAMVLVAADHDNGNFYTPSSEWVISYTDGSDHLMRLWDDVANQDLTAGVMTDGSISEMCIEMYTKNMSMWINGSRIQSNTDDAGPTITSIGRLGFYTNTKSAAFTDFRVWEGACTDEPANSGPTITWWMQVPDINISNLGQTINIVYNITDANGVASNATLYYKVNSTQDHIMLNDSGTTDASSHEAELVITGNVFNWSLEDNEVYPGVYNLNHSITENAIHTGHVIASKNTVPGVSFQGMAITPYNLLEVMITNHSNNSNPLQVWYCNRTDLDTKIIWSEHCTNFYTIEGGLQPNHFHGNSTWHMVIPFAINTSGYLNDVLLTDNGTFYFIPVTNNDWTIYYTDNYTTPTTTRITSGGGPGLNFQTYTFDSHIHQIDYTDNVSYWVVAWDNQSARTNGSLTVDMIGISDQPPNSPSIRTPIGGNYTGKINISYDASQSPNNYTIEFYNVSIWINNLSTRLELFNNSKNTWMIWENLSDYPNGDYMIRVDACDDQNDCSFALSELITISSVPDVTITYPIDNSSVGASFNYSITMSTDIGANCSLNGSWFTIYTGNFSHTFINQTIIDNNMTYNWACLNDYTGNWSNGTFWLLIDTTYPIYSIVNPLNESVYNWTFWIDVNVSDIRLYAVNYTIRNTSDDKIVWYQNYSEITNGSTWINVKEWFPNFTIPQTETHNFSFDIEASDSHTRMQWNEKVDIIKDYSDPEYNEMIFDLEWSDITLEYPKNLTIETQRVTDRIKLKLLSNETGLMTFNIQSKKVVYLDKSYYQCHLVIIDRYWFDCEGLDLVEIKKHHKQDNKYVITYRHTEYEHVTDSIGGLNIINASGWFLMFGNQGKFQYTITNVTNGTINNLSDASTAFRYGYISWNESSRWVAVIRNGTIQCNNTINNNTWYSCNMSNLTQNVSYTVWINMTLNGTNTTYSITQIEGTPLSTEIAIRNAINMVVRLLFLLSSLFLIYWFYWDNEVRGYKIMAGFGFMILGFTSFWVIDHQISMAFGWICVAIGFIKTTREFIDGYMEATQ